MAAVARRLCLSYVDPTGFRALLACRLIALSKNPGVHSIAIGETCQRIMSKMWWCCTMMYLKLLALLCAGKKGQCEAAVHTLRQAFQSSSVKAMLLIDTNNAFNSLNRQDTLQNIRQPCPSIARFLINTYRDRLDLFIGNQVLSSNEGIAQGDPLEMMMNTLATLPLIQFLQYILGRLCKHCM